MISNSKYYLFARLVTNSLFNVLQIIVIFSLASGYCLAERNLPDLSSHNAIAAFPLDPKPNHTEKNTTEKAIHLNHQCMRCHKKRKHKIPKVTFKGVHNKNIKSENCVSFHGKKGHHPKKNSTIISFSPDATTSVSVQNSQCLECHSLVSIRTKSGLITSMLNRFPALVAINSIHRKILCKECKEKLVLPFASPVIKTK
ncbi:MAG: hypothetical protein ACJAT7_001667 [Psychromonas sp.]|jgi:hypothetical protein